MRALGKRDEKADAFRTGPLPPSAVAGGPLVNGSPNSCPREAILLWEGHKGLNPPLRHS